MLDRGKQRCGNMIVSPDWQDRAAFGLFMAPVKGISQSRDYSRLSVCATLNTPWDTLPGMKRFSSARQRSEQIPQFILDFVRT